MRIVPTLLRVILALSLVLNGTGLATAHSGDADAHATAAAGMHQAPIEEVPCHGAAEAGVTTHKPNSVAAEGEVAKAGTLDHQGDIDCCDMGTCDSACPQPLSAALLAAYVTAAHARPVSHPQAMPATRAGPRLPHPIRPPIA